MLLTMNLEQLQSFVEVARIGHFTRAAAHLHLAQPSLSRQISTLESDLGAALFHRARGNITLTDAGESLLPLAKRMLADADTVRYEMQELAGLNKGRVRLGATPTLCISLVAEVLTSFHCEVSGHRPAPDRARARAACWRNLPAGPSTLPSSPRRRIGRPRPPACSGSRC